MSQKNCYCDECGEEATIFTLQSSLKIKACSEHAIALMQKHHSAFTIDAFDFIERHRITQST